MQQLEQPQDNLSDIKRSLFNILKYWPVLIISIIIAFSIAYLNNRYAPRVYPVNATILIESGTNNSAKSAAQLLYGNELLGGAKNLINETLILKSYPLILEVVNQLNLDKAFYNEGEFNTSQVYSKNLPFQVIVDTSSTRMPYNKSFYFAVKDQNSFYFDAMGRDDGTPENPQEYHFDELINISGFKLKFIKNEPFNPQKYSQGYVIFRLLDSHSLTRSYSNRLKVQMLEPGSSILQLSISGNIPDQEIDFLNKLIDLYIEKGLEDKNSNATKTIAFIDQQLQGITDTLFNVENQIEGFKIDNLAPSISVEGGQIYSELLAYEKERVELKINLNYFDYILNYIEENQDFESIVIPSTIGISDNLMNQLVNELVRLQTERNALFRQGQEQNPYIPVLTDKIQNLKNNIVENIQGMKRAATVRDRSLQEEIALLETELKQLPGEEREFINIQRQYELSENMYLFLMQKRTEAGITKASAVPDASIVEPPMLAGGAISPQTERNYLIAFFLGITVPVAFIFLRDFFNNKIRYKDELNSLTQIPFLGVVGHESKDKDLVVIEKPKSAIAESFRSIRSNIYFFTPGKERKVFAITSSISGEGKTFCSVNLSAIFAFSGKKTIIIGADLRKPRIFPDFKLHNNVGLSNYLISELEVTDIIQRTTVEHLDMISAGPIPPNPSELLMNGRLQILLEELKKTYHYIIIDTPPIGLVTDAFIIVKHVDHTIFMVRQNYTPKETIRAAQQMYETGKLKNISILFNDVKVQKYGYGYGYGYGYHGYYEEGSKKKNPFLKLFRK